MKTDLSRYDNSWYYPGRGALKRLIWYFVNLLLIKNHWNPVNSIKVGVLRAFGAKVGKGVVIKPGVSVKYPWLLSIGDYSWIGEDVWIDNLAQIKIGSSCCISQGSMLLTGNHDYKQPTFNLMVKPIVIEDGAWVGAKCVVCPGVTISSHAVLTVGSVATKPVEAYSICQGNPAKFIKKRVMEDV